MLDGNPRLNLASFVTTWMEPECDKLMMSSINKNYVDMDEYPVTTELQASFPPFVYLIITRLPSHFLSKTNFLYIIKHYLLELSHKVYNCSIRNGIT